MKIRRYELWQCNDNCSKYLEVIVDDQYHYYWRQYIQTWVGGCKNYTGIGLHEMPRYRRITKGREYYSVVIPDYHIVKWYV